MNEEEHIELEIERLFVFHGSIVKEFTVKHQSKLLRTCSSALPEVS